MISIRRLTASNKGPTVHCSQLSMRRSSMVDGPPWKPAPCRHSIVQASRRSSAP